MKISNNATVGEAYGKAMELTDPNEAREYFEALVERHMEARPDHDRSEAERIERSNLGYYAGYYDNETRQRVEALFSCAHPFFGAIAEKGAPTPEEAFEIGKRIGGRK